MLLFAQFFAQGIPDVAWGGDWPQFWIALSLCMPTVIIVCAVLGMAYQGKELPARMYRLLVTQALAAAACIWVLGFLAANRTASSDWAAAGMATMVALLVSLVSRKRLI